MYLRIWNEVAASQTAPTVNTDGVPLIRPSAGLPIDQGFEFDSALADDDEYTFIFKMTGTGTVAVTLNTLALYGWSNYPADWFFIGYLNGGVALAETDTDEITYCEQVRGLRNFTRVALAGTLGGGALHANAWLVRR